MAKLKKSDLDRANASAGTALTVEQGTAFVIMASAGGGAAYAYQSLKALQDGIALELPTAPEVAKLSAVIAAFVAIFPEASNGT